MDIWDTLQAPVGTDSVATATDGIATGVGITFAATDRLSFGTSIGYLNAKMDAPSTVVELWTLEARVDYDIQAVPGSVALRRCAIWREPPERDRRPR